MPGFNSPAPKLDAKLPALINLFSKTVAPKNKVKFIQSSLLAGVFSLICTIAEADTYDDFQSWFNLTATGHFRQANQDKSRWLYWLEGQQRNGEDSSRLSQTLFRTGLGYSLTERTSLWFGYAWIHTGVPFTDDPFTENRIWQQLLWVNANAYRTLSNRIRTEQRFENRKGKPSYRIREMLKLTVPFADYPLWYFASSDEVFWHDNNFIGAEWTGIDQNRFFIGLGYKFSANTAMEIGYMNQYIRRIDVPNFLSNIASINLYLNW